MTRAVSPVVGTLLIASITVVLAAILVTTIGTAAMGGPLGTTEAAETTSFARISADTTAEGEVLLTHEGGDPIDVREIRVQLSIDGTPLTHQPPVPFFSTTGYEAGPTGPFNSAADPTWDVGETASVTISESNTPAPESGDTLTVELYRDGRRLAQDSVSLVGNDPD